MGAHGMPMNRREFIWALGASAAVCGRGTASGSVLRSEPDFAWSYLGHFGMNCWKDQLTQDPGAKVSGRFWVEPNSADYVRFSETLWRRLTERLRAGGCNQIVIDLAEIVEYPSHPELAVRGSWSPNRLRGEIARLRAMGFEVVPKLNFSATHDAWLKDYHRMVSTRKYYEVCADVIRDVVEMFDGPRLFHLGFDEETAHSQRRHEYVAVRQGELWWHDFLYLVGIVEKAGCRPWIWSDFCWHHEEEFLKRMPRSVLQSNWYYNENFAPKDEKELGYVRTFDKLDRAGFDQVPAGSNVLGVKNLPNMIDYCRRHCTYTRLKGYMMASWALSLPENEKWADESVDILAACVRAGR